MVLYRKYRPQKFTDLVGQKHIAQTLLAALEAGKISHGYLFFGPKGTGKTSTARILAKAVNCQNYQKQKFGEPCNKCTSCLTITDGSNLDLMEVDAASNRGIDEIRDLREKIKLSPVSARFKTYIIDEAHMLTTEAFNALLKTLEEPPRHVIFILCTTNISKIPATIVSRLSRFNFKYAAVSDILAAVEKVAKAEKIKIDSDAFLEIAKVSAGSYRDALSILDQLAAGGRKITVSDVRASAFAPGEVLLDDFILALAVKDIRAALVQIEDSVKRDLDFSVFCAGVILVLEKALLFKIGASDEQDLQIKKISEKITFADLLELMKLFLIAEGEIESYPLAHIPVILAACKYCGEVSEVLQVEEKNKSKTINKHAREGKIKSLAQIETLWGEFLARMKPVNAHLVAILRATKPTEFDGERLTIVTFWRFHKEKLEEPKIISICEKILSEVLGQDVYLKVTLAQKWEKPPRVVRESDVVEVESSDLVSMANEIFSK